MADRRRPRALLALLMLVALVLITLDFRQGDDGPLSELQRAAFGAFAPLQEAASSVTRPVGEFLGGLSDIGQRRERIAALEAELERLRQREIAVADLERENAELRELVDMRDRRELSTVTARVVAQPPGGTRWSVLIDLGASDGVEPNMAVIDADGLVGRIVQVAPDYARVELAVSPDARYAARVAAGGQQALLSGQGQSTMELQVLDATEAEFDAGTDVVTRAFQGSRIPDGLPVGTLVDGGAADSTPSFQVDPAVDFSTLNLVMVVVDVPEVPTELRPEEGNGDSDASGDDEPAEGDGTPDADGDAGDGNAAAPGGPSRVRG